jgi:peptidyl-prolyl cis-trans isomerase A (cyclophilin A)
MFRLVASLVALTVAAVTPAFSQALMNPAALNEPAPATFKAKFDTSKGAFVIEVHRDWAPNGADRFYNLVKNGFFDNARFFRVISGFMVQFGISGDPKISAHWHDANISDDPVRQSNTRGMITFATAGPNTRTTQVFINFADNRALDRQGADYGEGAPSGHGPEQGRVQREGNAYLTKDFAQLDYIKKATIEP